MEQTIQHQTHCVNPKMVVSELPNTPDHFERFIRQIERTHARIEATRNAIQEAINIPERNQRVVKSLLRTLTNIQESIEDVSESASTQSTFESVTASRQLEVLNTFKSVPDYPDSLFPGFTLQTQLWRNLIAIDWALSEIEKSIQRKSRFPLEMLSHLLMVLRDIRIQLNSNENAKHRIENSLDNPDLEWLRMGGYQLPDLDTDRRDQAIQQAWRKQMANQPILPSTDDGKTQIPL